MPLCTINTNHPSFRNGAKDAVKRHRSFASDLKKALEEIEKDPMACGDQIKCSDPTMHTRKLRIGCESERVAPRGGYRLIYQVCSVDGKLHARLLDLYYKPKQADIEAGAVKRLIDLAPPDTPTTDNKEN